MECQYKNTKRHMSLSHILRQVNRFHLTSLLVRFRWKIQHRQCPRVASRSNVLRIHWTVRNLRNRTGGYDHEDSALLSAYHHDLEEVSEHFKDGKGVFSGTGMPDTSDSAWLAITTKTETQKSEPTTQGKSAKLSQKGVDNLLVSLSLDEETNNNFAAIPIQRRPAM